MYALRERRVHVTQEDLELAVAKVSGCVCLSRFCLHYLAFHVKGCCNVTTIAGSTEPY